MAEVSKKNERQKPQSSRPSRSRVASHPDWHTSGKVGKDGYVDSGQPPYHTHVDWVNGHPVYIEA